MGFVDGSSHHIQNLASIAWVIYNSTGHLVSFEGACLGSTTNNIADYWSIIELFPNSISIGIIHIIVHPNSQLEVS